MKYYQDNNSIIKTLRDFYNKGELIVGIKKSIQSKFNRLFFSFIMKTKKNFLFNNKLYPYFYHKYHNTFENERCIEIPIIKSFIQPDKKILEVGATLCHYVPNHNWVVVDKFEKYNGVLNKDIMEFFPNHKFDLIISISTLEHVGFNDKKSTSKTIDAIHHLIKHCLADKGKMIITMALGHNPHVDYLVYNKQLPADKVYFMKRINNKNEYQQTTMEDIKGIKHNWDERGIVVAIFEK